jgi:hypothetical protein
MAEEGLLYGDRTWFFDPRTPVRRMGVSVHPDHGLVVLSFWAGDSCTSTFRMPMADAARLIATLADGMATSLPDPTPVVPAPEPEPTGWRALVARVLRHRRASVTHLTAVR